MPLHKRAMPLQNRVCPDGEIIATTARGTMMGNRGGRIHMPDRRLGRRWVTKQWIACRLDFHERHRQVMSPNSYTELFFLDEATALAAGHRPCFECRRGDAVEFATRWAAADGLRGEPAGADHAPTRTKAGTMDERLHLERLTGTGAKRCHDARLADLPDGVFIKWRGSAHLWLDGRMLPWAPSGYGGGKAVSPAEIVSVLTPRTIVTVILSGYCPGLHQSATHHASSQDITEHRP